MKKAHLPHLITMLALAACAPEPLDAPAGPDAGALERRAACPDCECLSDTDCGIGSVCADTGERRVCRCADGYGGEACTWTGVVRSPGFTDPAAWSGGGSVVVAPEELGFEEPGEALFSATSICALDTLSQVVTLPPRDSSEPLIARLRYTSAIDAHRRYPGVGFALGGAWRELPARSSPDYATWRERRVCLGEAAYGGSRELVVSTGRRSLLCPDTSAALRVDHLSIEPAGANECPAPGEVRNGDFEREGGWLTIADEASTVAIEDEVGEGGSRGARIATTRNCSRAAIEGELSVPLHGSPALEIWWQASAGTLASLQLDELAPRTLVGSGAPERLTTCVPPAMAGAVHALRASIARSAGQCSDSVDRELVIDSVRLFDDPACAEEGGLLDPGFEHMTQRELLGSFGTAPIYGEPGGTVTIVEAGELARSGDGVLEISRHRKCTMSGHRRWIVPPRADERGGPAVRFSYKVPLNANTSAGWSTEGSAGTLEEGADWQQQTVCLDPAYEGRPVPFRVMLRGDGGQCTELPEPERAYFDDFEVIRDPSCL